MIKDKRRINNPMPWSADFIAFCMTNYFSGERFEEVGIGHHREDIVFVSSAGYVTVCETKISKADWVADFKKSKWRDGFRPYIKSFYFIVPEFLLKDIPKQIPEWVGIIGIEQTEQGYIRHIMHRKCSSVKGVEKIPDRIRHSWYRAYYYRLNDKEYRRRLKYRQN